MQFYSYGSNHLLIDTPITTLNIEIINVCNKGKKYVASFNVCNSC